MKSAPIPLERGYQYLSRGKQGRVVTTIMLALLSVIGGVACVGWNHLLASWNTLLPASSAGSGGRTISAALAVVGIDPEPAFLRAFVTPEPPAAECYTSTTSWQNDPFSTETSPFFAQFDTTPNVANMDGVTGLSSGPALYYGDLAAIVRFSPTGFLDARDGGTYRADTVVPYSPGLTYHYRLLVYPATHLYTIYVTPPGSAETILGANFHFRSEQSATSSLSHWSLYADIPSHTVCGFGITSDTSSDITAPSAAVIDPIENATVSGTVSVSANARDNIRVVGVQLKVDGKLLGAELTALPYTRSWDTTPFSNGTHILTATARDAAGNATTSAPITVIVQNGSSSDGCLQSSSVWQNTPIATETVPFQASFDDMPKLASMDGVTGLSLGNAIYYIHLAAIVRFNSSGFIDARNGGTYVADASVPYSPGLNYHFRLQIYPAAHVYTIFVTPPASPEITLGTSFAFRTEQSGVSSLNNWALYSEKGSHKVCNFAVAAISQHPPQLIGLSLNPTSVKGGQSSHGTVTLSGPAPAGGAVVTLTSQKPLVARVPSSVTVPAGTTTVQFLVNTSSVSASTTTAILSTYGGLTISRKLTVNH
jgi:hypothetical protein